MVTLAPGWQLNPLVPVAVAAVFALLLVLRVRGRVDRAWAALLAPGTSRWGTAAAFLGLFACTLLAAGALPALLGADCQAAVSAQGLLRGVAALGVGFTVGGVLCLAARAMLAPAADIGRDRTWPAAGRAVGVSGLACVAFAWALAGSGFAALTRSADGAGQPMRLAWAAQAREVCRIDEAALPPSQPAAVQPPAAQPTVVQAANPAQERLLAEIRDLLRDQQRRAAQQAAQAASLPPIPPAYVPPRTEPSRTEARPTVRRPLPPRPGTPFYGYPYEY